MPEGDDVDYLRRRADAAHEKRLERIETELDSLGRKLDALSIRVAVIAALISVVTFAANVIGPILAIRFLGG